MEAINVLALGMLHLSAGKESANKVSLHTHGDTNSLFVHKEMSGIREVVEFERANANVTHFELFKPNMINRTHIDIFTHIWSLLTGMNVIRYYITYMLTSKYIDFLPRR